MCSKNLLVVFRIVAGPDLAEKMTSFSMRGLPGMIKKLADTRPDAK
jgi:hypothetical protein